MPKVACWPPYVCLGMCAPELQAGAQPPPPLKEKYKLDVLTPLIPAGAGTSL